MLTLSSCGQSNVVNPFGANQFVSTWNPALTSAGSSTATQVRLPLVSTGTYNFVVDWGDGTSDTITVWNQAQTTHTYSVSKLYQIKITGTCNGWRFANTGDRLKILSVEKWGTDFRLGATDQHFNGCNNLELQQVDDVLDLTGTTSFASSFRDCGRLTVVRNMNSWNTTNITSLNNTFAFSPNFNTNIGDWNTENVTNMERTFDATGGLGGTAGKFNQYIGNWNTSKVTTLRTMFWNQTSFNQDISTKEVTVGGVTYTAWDTLNVIDMGSVFANFGNFGTFNQNIGNWNTSKATNMGIMFSQQTSFNQDISTKVVTVGGVTYTAWDTLNVTAMNSMLRSDLGNGGTFNQNIGNWNTSKVTNMSIMFFGQRNFNQDISTKVVTVGGNTYIAWDTLNVTNFGSVFGLTAGNFGIFNQNIGNWNTSKGTIMSSMFSRQLNFNQDISTKTVTVGANTYTAWDTLNVTNMSFILNSPPFGNFNQNIGNWNTSKVTNMSALLQFQSNFNQDISTKTVTVGANTYTAWDTINVTNMSSFLYVSNDYNGSFNQNISNWNTSKLTNASFMFSNQSNFNQNIGIWDVSKVTNMPIMLLNTTNFNQNLGSWNVSLVTIFDDATLGGFADGIGLSTANYDALLIGWSSRLVQPNLAINFGTVKYSSGAISARAILTSAPNNWTIVDGGLE
jgi:surface protein